MTSPSQRQRRVRLNSLTENPEVSALTPLEQQIRKYWVDSLTNLFQQRTGGQTEATKNLGDYRPTWDGGASAAGKVYEPVWPKLAKLNESGVNPFLLIDVFLTDWPGINIPSPSAVLSESCLRKYYEQPSPEEIMRVKLKIQVDESLAMYSRLVHNPAYQHESQIWRSVVSNLRSSLSILFRYCLAVETGIDDMAKQLFTPAAQEYLLRRNTYDKVWGSRIPPSLRNLSTDGLVQQVSGKGLM